MPKTFLTEGRVDDNPGLTAVESNFSYVSLVAPIGPIEITLTWIQRNGSWFLQTFMQKDLSESAVQFGDFNRISFFVTPIQVTAHPIDS